MQITPTPIPGLLVIDPVVWGDSRGFFLESFQADRYRDAGIDATFVQDNLSRSRRGTLRGLHYQIERPQGKLVQVVAGEIWDVVVDLRRSSPTFGQWAGFELSDANHRQLYVPPGLAHGFCVLSESVDFLYKCTEYYSPARERTVLWNDPQLAVTWPEIEPRIISAKDSAGTPWPSAEYYD